MASGDHEEIRKFLADEAAGRLPPGKRVVLNPMTGKFSIDVGITAANFIASGVVGNAAYALLTSTVGKFRARISHAKSSSVQILGDDEALNLARALIASYIDCNPDSLDFISRLYDPDDKSWTVSLRHKNTLYDIRIPYGDPERVKCFLWESNALWD